MEQTIYRLQGLSEDRTFETIQEKSTGEEQLAIENTVGGQSAATQSNYVMELNAVLKYSTLQYNTRVIRTFETLHRSGARCNTIPNTARQWSSNRVCWPAHHRVGI